MPAATTAKKAATVAARPFIRAAHKLTQPAFTVTTAAIGAAAQDFGPIDVPSGGYLRSILLHVKASGGNLGPGALNPDAPWNVFKSIELADVNGQALTYPSTDGYVEYIHNRYGSFAFSGIPDLSPVADLTDPVAFEFMMRVPVEIDATDGYGSLPNLNAAEPYRLRFTVADLTAVYSANPTGAPILTIKGYAEDWSLPAETDGKGVPQETKPPAMNTTQYLSKFVVPINAGLNTIRLTRTGNLLRGVYFICRGAAGARIAAGFPDDAVFTWDKYQIRKESEAVCRQKMAEQFGQYGYAIPDGVYVYSFTEDGSAPGNEKRNLWLPTMQPTQLMLEGTFPAGMAGGTLEIVTNDVAVSASSAS